METAPYPAIWNALGSTWNASKRAPAFDRLADFFDSEATADWFPNRLAPNGEHRDLAAMRRSAERGAQVMESQRYAIRHALSAGDHVALEVDWTGTLAIAYESIPAGGQMRAHFAMFLTFRDGKIISQRNYDCFEPF